MFKRAPYQICQPDIIIIAQNNIASRGKAGELGRRRIGTVEFLKYGLCPTKFLSLPFSSLRRLALETISSPFPVLGNSVPNKRRKTAFSGVMMSRVHLFYQKSFFLEH